MARPNLEKMSLKQLLDLESQVQSAIASTRERERAEVKKAMAELAEKRGFSLQELMGGRGKGKISVAKYANPKIYRRRGRARSQTQLARCEAEEGCGHVGFRDLAASHVAPNHDRCAVECRSGCLVVRGVCNDCFGCCHTRANRKLVVAYYSLAL